MSDVSLARRIGAGDDDEPVLLARRYEALEVVAEGGQGELVRAWDHHHNRPVALKIRAAGPGVDRDRLLAEARALLNIRPHPNMAFVRDDFFDGDKHYLVLDWVSGEDLRTRLRSDGRPGLPFEVVAQVAQDIGSVLAHLHGHQPPVVHGDVKPANIVLTDQEDRARAVLVDFGNSSAGAQLSAVTLEYAAPEVLAGAIPTPASDVYALAATTFELLTGRVATPGATLDWSAVPPEQVPHVRDALMNGLATKPEQRSPTAIAFVEKLTSGHSPQRRIDVKQSRRRRLRTRLAIAAALILGAAGGSVSYALGSDSGPSGPTFLSEAQLLNGSLGSGVKAIGRLGVYQTWGYFNTYTIGDDGTAVLSYHQENMAHGWPTIVPVIDDQVLFYNPSQTDGAIVEWHRYGTLLDLYDVPSIGGNWSHIRQLRPGTLFMYNQTTGATQLMSFTNNSETPIVTRPGKTALGWTRLAPISATEMLAYSARTGHAQLFDIGKGGSHGRDLSGLPPNLEAVDGLGDGRIVYGDSGETSLHVASVAGGKVHDLFTVDLHGTTWDQEIAVAADRVVLYSSPTGQSVLVSITAKKGSLGPTLGLLPAAKVLVGNG